jgi:hypothetical protein
MQTHLLQLKDLRLQWPWFLVNTMDKIKRFGILDNEQKKQVMKKMRSNSKADFVDVVIETIKQKRRKVNGNTKFN